MLSIRAPVYSSPIDKLYLKYKTVTAVNRARHFHNRLRWQRDTPAGQHQTRGVSFYLQKGTLLFTE